MAQRIVGLWATGLVIVMLLTAACDTSLPETPPPLSPVPGPSEIETVGTIVSESSRDTTTDFSLSDGRVITVDLSTKRRVGPPGGSPAILVMGHDNQGGWIAEIGHQDGTPDDCHVLNELGYELGDSIAIGGVRWQKAPTFHSSLPSQVGEAYAQGARFCLNDQAQVTGIINP